MSPALPDHSPSSQPAGPLTGIRVVDCSTVLAGPYCTMILGDLGADVVKIEPPEGDATRGWGPPWVGEDGEGTRTAAYYLSVNRNKRSLRLDLSGDDGREILRRLLRTADVVVENFRVGGFERLGFSDDVLREVNPDLVHLAISGFGTSGPDAAKPGYDFIVQAVGGLMSITGEADGRPVKVGVAISDVVTGLFGAVSILAALAGRARATAVSPHDEDRGATGQRIDVSLLESTLAVLVNQAQNAIVTGRGPARRGNAHPSIVPYQSFATADDEIVVSVGSERQWPRLCEAVGLPELASDTRFATNGARVEHRVELTAILDQRFAEAPAAAWLERLDAAGVPCGPILDVREALTSRQAEALGSVVPLRHPRLGPVDQVAPPFQLSATPASIRMPPPLVGEHADEILGEVGYDPPAIARLRAAGVV